MMMDYGNGDLHSQWKKKMVKSSYPLIPKEPETPREPMEFLARSWSLSASQISKALLHKLDNNFNQNPLFLNPPHPSSNFINGRKTGTTVGKWFHHKDDLKNSCTMRKKDQVRVENARLHSAISIAGLASALAAVAAAGNSAGSKMAVALASATELLASHCVELAELAGADHDRVTSAVRSAVDIHTCGDLMTLTAAAATALRGEAALKARLPKEARKNATISPYDNSSHFPQSSHPFAGDLLQHTRKGVLRLKRVSVYINNNSQVIIKLKNKHVGGAFSKKHKYVVYGVCNEMGAWPYKRERENTEEVYFGLKTAKGLLEFKCESKAHKQTWINGIQNLLNQNSCTNSIDESVEFLSPSNTI